MSLRTIATLFILLLITLFVVSCVAGPNNMAKTPDANGRIAGFWLGLWQGFISPITWFISLFIKNIHFYEVHNNGGWYNFGFVVGAGIIFGSGHKARIHYKKGKTDEN
jgi:hypothetical protein